VWGVWLWASALASARPWAWVVAVAVVVEVGVGCVLQGGCGGGGERMCSWVLGLGALARVSFVYLAAFMHVPAPAPRYLSEFEGVGGAVGGAQVGASDSDGRARHVCALPA